MFERLAAAFAVQQVDSSLRVYYDHFGQYTFPVYGQSGGLQTRKVAYLYKPKSVKTIWTMAVWMPLRGDGEAELVAAAHKFNDKAKVVDVNSGDMGLPDQEEV